MRPVAPPRRPRPLLALIALAVLASLLMPITASEAHSDGQPDPTSAPATDPCEEGSELNDDGQCETTETEPAEAVCPATIQSRAVTPSGDGCVTTSPHTMAPTYACTTANADHPQVRFALAGDPPECRRQVSGEETVITEVTDMVQFTETYEVEVETTERVREPYTVWVEQSYVERVRVAPFTRTYLGMEPYTYTVQVRVAPFSETTRESYVVQVRESYVVQVRVAPTSETVRVAPFSETVTGTRTRTVRYCAQHDTEFGSGCIRWASRTETVPYTEVVEAFNYDTREVFNYRSEVHFRYVPETRWRDVTREVFNFRPEERSGVRETLITEDVLNFRDEVRIRMVEETRHRWVDRTVITTETRERLVCCRPVTREVPVTRTVTRTETAVPDASCAAAGYSVNSASECSQPAGVRLGDAAYVCGAGWAAAEDDRTQCERTVTQAPEWDCPAAPRHTLDASTSPPHCHVADGVCPPVRLGSLGTGTAAHQHSWAAGCRSERRGSVQSPHWARSWSFALEAAASVSVSVASAHNAFVYVIDAATGEVVASGSAIGSVQLAAGSYVVEVTTATARAAGSFTVTVEVASRSRVTISGLAAGAETPQAGDDTATVTSGFTVSPAGAVCSASPAGAAVADGPGAARAVSYDVPAGTSVDVTVTCRSGTHFATRSVRLTARPAPPPAPCDDPLGTLGQGAVSRSGTLGSASGCRSLGRFGRSGSRSHYASRHTFTMAAAGWVTIDLENTGRGRARIDAYVVLINGADPAGGTVLRRNDDSGRGSNSRIVRKWLAPGRYTIEATTFGRRDAGTYRLTVAADYTPKISGQPTRLSVRNGTTATATWNYRPAAATVGLASAFPDGIAASVSAAAGTATLTATPSRVGQYAVLVSYANGPESFTRATTIDSYCPTGQEELPSDCGLPRAARTPHIPFRLIFHPDDDRVPEGYEDANYCAGVKIAERKWRYTCRTKPVIQRAYISKSDPRILGISEPYSRDGTNHGRTMLWRSSNDVVEGWEGCQAVTAKVWQCDYRTSHFWSIELDRIGSADLIGPAIKKFLLGQAQVTGRIAQCAAAVLGVIASLRQGSLDPQAGASVATDCPEAGPTGS